MKQVMIMKVKIQTLTPLWTGGIDGSCDRIHETGIIGSMRWWYEAIVRGLGGSACDPSQHECIFDVEKYRKSTAKDERQRLKDAGLCDVCQVFGATGRRRRFRLDVIDKSELLFDGHSTLVPSGHIRDTKYGRRAGGWYIGPGRVASSKSGLGDIFLDFSRVLPCVEEQIIPTLMMIERWGGIGAKNQLGYGVVGFNRCVKNECLPLEAKPISPMSNKIYNGHSPALTDFFFSKIRFNPGDENWWRKFEEIGNALNGKIDDVKLTNPITESIARDWLVFGSFPIAPVIRNWIHYNLYSKQPHNLQNYFLGTAKQVCPMCYNNIDYETRWCIRCKRKLSKEQIIERVASKVKISSSHKIPHSDCWEFRIWGWLPQQAPNREKLLETLYDAVRPTGGLWSGPFKHIIVCEKAVDWREFRAPTRDLSRYRDPSEFICSLLGEEKHDL